MRDSTEYWFDNIAAAHELYVRGEPVKSNAEPMLAAIVAWLEKIDAAMQKAKSEGCQYFSCRLAERPARIVLRFEGADRRGFERAVHIDERFRRHDVLLTDSEIIDLKICIQSLIASEPHRLSRLPLDSHKFTPLDAISLLPNGIQDIG
jgi:hypothetical protein